MAKAGVDTGHIEERIVEIYPEFRKLLYDYLLDKGAIDPALIGDKSKIGEWRFIPENTVAPAMNKDMYLLFGKK